MKSKQFLAVSIMMLSLQTVHAQGHIKHAFNVLTTDTSTKVESTHKLNKDPETGTKTGQLDVFEFTIPASHHNLLEDIKQAFDQKENLKMEKEKEKEYIILKMVIDMKENGKMTYLKEKEYIILKMVKDMKENLKMMYQKEKEYIIIKVVIDMKENLKMAYLKEKEYFILIMVRDMKENGKMVIKKEKEYFIIMMVIEKWVII